MSVQVSVLNIVYNFIDILPIYITKGVNRKKVKKKMFKGVKNIVAYLVLFFSFLHFNLLANIYHPRFIPEGEAGATHIFLRDLPRRTTRLLTETFYQNYLA
jgi:hypothetical protein